MIPVWFKWTSAMRKKIPAIIAQTPRSMMPSIPLESRPLEMSQMMPQRAIRMKKAQIRVISSALPFGDIPNSLPAAVAVIE
jgi:hypothetical protein